MQCGTEPIFDQCWLTEMAEIHRGSTGGDFLRGNPGLSLTEMGPGESGDQAAHVIDQIGRATGDPVHRYFSAELLTPDNAE
jgi:hypothetical protein